MTPDDFSFSEAPLQTKGPPRKNRSSFTIYVLLFLCAIGLVVVPVASYFTITAIIAHRERQQAANDAPENPRDRNLKNITSSKPPLAIGKPAFVNNIKIELVSGKIGKLRLVDLFDRSEHDSEKEYAQITYRVSNLTETFILDYVPWGITVFGGSDCYFRDEFDNKYPCYSRTSSERIAGTKRILRLQPGESLEDVVAFEAPLKNAKEFTLTLHAINVTGNTGTEPIVYKIPRAWFGK